MYDRKKSAAVITGILSVAVMVMIFYFSAQGATDSKEMSNGVFKLLCAVAHVFIRSDESRTAFDGFLEMYIRKYAHFTEYTLLGFFLTLFFADFQPKISKLAPLPLLTGVIYACSDEWHQTFIPGRSGELRDILIDSGGLALGLLLALLFLWLLIVVKRRKKRYSNSKAPV